MRIAISGTHASGKSTLISDFAAAHRDVEVMPDPFELIDESDDRPGPGMLLRQLRASADRLEQNDSPTFIAERSPLDFLAYLLALDELGRGTASDEVIERARELTASALRHIDLLAVLPLSSADRIWVGDDEDPDLREAMDAALLDLLDDPDLIPATTHVIEITGDRATRLAALEAALAD
ncbi:AAA family ATPase [Microbacterium sp. NPDC064584]|uniref:AAA family ATPase n=1 Tax=Microbacterium sp. NPDC064584 TaxID=3155817 RepID=UPI003446E21F